MNHKYSSAMKGFASAAVVSETRADGSIVLRCPRAVGPYARCIGEYQRAVLTRRYALVERLHAVTPGEQVILRPASA